MSSFIRRGGLALPALLITITTGTALAVPAQAASSWSPPVQLPAGCVSSGSVPGLAVNAAGTEAAAGSQLNADNSSSVLVCTSADGQTWPAPATVGQGTSPAVALAPDGRAVTAWDGGPFNAPVIQASVRPPGGTWSTPVTVGTDARGPLIGIDRAGNAIIAWAGAAGTIHTASLPAGGSWTPAQTLATNYGSGLAMAVNSAGSAVLTWAAKGTGVGTYADSGTILGGFAAPVKVGLPPYPGGRTSVALNDAGQAAMVWAMGLGAVNVAATRSAAGTWSAPAQLSANEAGNLNVAIDGAGDAVATFKQYVPNTSIIALYASKLPAGGSWGAAGPAVPARGLRVELLRRPRRGRLRRDLRHRLDRRHHQDPERAHQPARRRLRARHFLPRRGSDQPARDRPGSCGADLQLGGDH